MRSTKMMAQQWEGAPPPTPYRFFAPQAHRGEGTFSAFQDIFFCRWIGSALSVAAVEEKAVRLLRGHSVSHVNLKGSRPLRASHAEPAPETAAADDQREDACGHRLHGA